MQSILITLRQGCGHLGRGIGRAFTSRDNRTPDVFRVLVLIAGLAVIGVFVWATFGLKQEPKYEGFGTAFAAVLASGGAAIWAKRKDEPDAKPPCE